MKPAKNPAPASSPKFEAALAELEEIVEQMENAELPLDKLIERYERGMQLVKVCGEKLSEAEQKVEILTKAQPAKAEKSRPAAPKPDKGADGDDSEVSLF
jgi:exodeoxyribonuclease VII small subunit